MRWTCAQMTVPRTIGRGARAVTGVAALLGMQPAQACTVTVPYWSS
jgi:hypothetical protein